MNSAGKSRMASRARRDLWKMKADRKQSRRKWEMEWKEKSITETVETEMKDHQVRNLEPGTCESRVDKRGGS